MGRSAAERRRGSAALSVSRNELLVDDSDAVFRHFVHGILALSERWNTVRSGFGAYLGLSGIQYTILATIAHMQTEGNVSVRRIADHLNLSGTFITTVTGQLESAELIRKDRDPQDRRRVCLMLTPEGRSVLRRLGPLQRQINDELFACLNRRDFRKLTVMVDDLIACADRAISLQKHLNTR